MGKSMTGHTVNLDQWILLFHFMHNLDVLLYILRDHRLEFPDYDVCFCLNKKSRPW